MNDMNKDRFKDNVIEITHDDFFNIIDTLQNDGVIVASHLGYRIARRYFIIYQRDPNELKDKLKDEYVEFNYNATKEIIRDNRDKTDRKKERERKKEGFYKRGTEILNGETKSFKPRLNSGNYIADLISIMFFYLAGKTGRGAYITIHEIIEGLKGSWVFIG